MNRTCQLSSASWLILVIETSSSLNSNLFSFNRDSWTVFGTTDVPRWTAQDNRTWAEDLLYSPAIEPIYVLKDQYSILLDFVPPRMRPHGSMESRSLWQGSDSAINETNQKGQPTVASSNGPGWPALGFTAATGLPPRGWCAVRWIFSLAQKLKSSCCGRYLTPNVQFYSFKILLGQYVRMKFYLIDGRSYPRHRQYMFRLENVEVGESWYPD